MAAPMLVVLSMQAEHLAAMEDQMQEWGWLDSAALVALEPADSHYSPGLDLIKGSLAGNASSLWSPGPRSAFWI